MLRQEIFVKILSSFKKHFRWFTYEVYFTYVNVTAIRKINEYSDRHFSETFVLLI